MLTLNSVKPALLTFINRKHLTFSLLNALSLGTSVTLKLKGILNPQEFQFVIRNSKYFEAALNLKLSTYNYFTQTLDLFSYQINHKSYQIVAAVYYTTRLNITHSYFYVSCTSTTAAKSLVFKSCEAVFYNFWWFEREVTELTGLAFTNKRDSRNLLLEYNNVFKPHLREFPSVGIFELFYDFLNQNLIHSRISLQF